MANPNLYKIHRGTLIIAEEQGSNNCVGVAPCEMGFWATPRSAGIRIINDVILEEKRVKMMNGGLYTSQEC